MKKVITTLLFAAATTAYAQVEMYKHEYKGVTESPTWTPRTYTPTFPETSTMRPTPRQEIEAPSQPYQGSRTVNQFEPAPRYVAPPVSVCMRDNKGRMICP